jgi:uncharacterized phage protein gp47/JayE
VADITDFLPVIQETADSIRARVDADVNAGLSPSDAAYIDTTPGGMYYDLTQGIILEIERAYDTMGTDIPASFLPLYSWGTYLDELGFTVGIERNDAARADGVVSITGADGTLLGVGLQVAVSQTDPEANPVVFETTEVATIGISGVIDVPIQAVEPGAAGNVAAGLIDMILSPTTAESVTNEEAITGGADVETDATFRERVLLEWQAAHGGGTIADFKRWALDHDGVGHARVIAVSQGPGTVRVIVTDADNKPMSAAEVTALQIELDPPSAETQLNGGVTLPIGTITVDSTTDFESAGRIRIGNTVVNYTGKTPTTLTGCTSGFGVFLDNEPVYQVGKGAGVAPIGAIALVSTPAVTSISVDLQIEFQDGYSLTGADGSIATQDDIELLVREYLDTLPPGDDVIRNHIISQVFQVPGVEDVTDITINGTSDPTIPIDDDHVAESGTITFA